MGIPLRVLAIDCTMVLKLLHRALERVQLDCPTAGLFTSNCTYGATTYPYGSSNGSWVFLVRPSQALCAIVLLESALDRTSKVFHSLWEHCGVFRT